MHTHTTIQHHNTVYSNYCLGTLLREEERTSVIVCVCTNILKGMLLFSSLCKWGCFPLLQSVILVLCLLLHPISAALNNERFNCGDFANEINLIPSAVSTCILVDLIHFFPIAVCFEEMTSFEQGREMLLHCGCGNSFKVRGCCLSGGVSKPLNVRLSKAEMTVGKLIL